MLTRDRLRLFASSFLIPPAYFPAVHASVFAALVLALALPARGEPPALNSHEVNADQSVTFRYYGPAARQVTLSMENTSMLRECRKSGLTPYS